MRSSSLSPSSNQRPFPLLDLLKAELARREAAEEMERVNRDADQIRARCGRLIEFVKEFWPVLEPPSSAIFETREPARHLGGYPWKHGDFAGLTAGRGSHGDEKRTEIHDLLDMLQGNLGKIVHHGERADVPHDRSRFAGLRGGRRQHNQHRIGDHCHCQPDPFDLRGVKERSQWLDARALKSSAPEKSALTLSIPVELKRRVRTRRASWERSLRSR
jgi:hypothetical protein